MSKLKVAVVQHACSDNYEQNLQAGIDGIKSAAAQDADLVLLPELSMGRYFCIKEDPGNSQSKRTSGCASC